MEYSVIGFEVDKNVHGLVIVAIAGRRGYLACKFMAPVTDYATLTALVEGTLASQTAAESTIQYLTDKVNGR
mgnify:CR=1 FL=1